MKNNIPKKDQNNNIKKIIKEIRVANWKKEPYRFQNWANWLHRMSPYVGKIKPSMAHWLIKITSKENDVVLDPFCGIGTIPLEADLLGRKAIGVDLNPYAHSILKAKFDRRKLEEHLKWLDSINMDTSNIDLKRYSPFVKKFYHPKTLKEITFLIDLIKKEKKYFLLGCLLGIIHGHRPGHLSAVTSLVIPFDPREKAEYKEVIPRLKDKVKRMYKDGFSIKTIGTALYADARKIPIKDNSVDVIITSPPYFDTLDYVSDNRLRLEFLGFNSDKKNKLKEDLIQNKEDYIEEMIKVGVELKRVLKNKGLCIFILGDLHKGNKIINTAEEIKEVYNKIGFKTHEIIEDAMPINKCVPSSYKRLKMDRIMIMTNE